MASEQRNPRDDLFELLPALYRIRDGADGPLRALLVVIGEQMRVVRENIEQLDDDLFIETCAPWVVPYIGDLVGSTALHEIEGLGARRADVAHTIHHRRRKGTVIGLEQIARDATGWDARAAAFFERIGWMQNLNHLRMEPSPDPRGRDPRALRRVGTVNLRDVDALDTLDGPFDSVAHTVDLRPIERWAGWYGIRKVGFFLWRLQNDPISGATACPSKKAEWTPPGGLKPVAYGFHASPLGNPIPLFQRPGARTKTDDPTVEDDIAGPIRPRAFAVDLERCRALCRAGSDWQGRFYERSVQVFRDGLLLGAPYVECADLATWRRPSGLVAGFISSSINPALAADVVRTAIMSKLGLTDADAVWVILGRHAPPSGALPAGAEVGVRVDRGPVIAVSLSSWPGNPASPPQALQAALRNAGNASSVDGLKDARVVELCGRLLICAGKPKQTLAFGPTARDAHTAAMLGIESRVAVDVATGRLTFGFGDEPQAEVIVEFNQGFSAPMGGGGYSRPGSVRPQNAPPATYRPIVKRPPRDSTTAPPYHDLANAITSWPANAPVAVVTIEDSATYELPATLAIPANRELVLQAASGHRPLLRFSGGQLKLGASSAAAPSSDSGGILRLAGVLIEGGILVEGNALTELYVTDCTLVPGKALDENSMPLKAGEPSIRVESSNERFRLTLQRSISGPIFVHPDAEHIAISDSIIDSSNAMFAIAGQAPAGAGVQLSTAVEAPPLTLLRSTLFGAVRARALDLASEVIFDGPVSIVRRQGGCVRFSYVAPSTEVPQRYRCQPDLALEKLKGDNPGNEPSPADADKLRARVKPVFVSKRYGDPAYAQLGASGPIEIRTGAEDGSEMGAFERLKQPQRESNLRARLSEYLPFGLEAGLIYVT